MRKGESFRAVSTFLYVILGDNKQQHVCVARPCMCGPEMLSWHQCPQQSTEAQILSGLPFVLGCCSVHISLCDANLCSHGLFYGRNILGRAIDDTCSLPDTTVADDSSMAATATGLDPLQDPQHPFNTDWKLIADAGQYNL